MNTLLGVFLLFQDEHDVVKELLQFLIGEVNTQLLEAVVLHGEYLQVIYVYIYKLDRSVCARGSMWVRVYCGSAPI